MERNIGSIKRRLEFSLKRVPTDEEVCFVLEFLDLLDKHGVSLTAWQDYDGEDRLCGTEYEFVGPRIKDKDTILLSIEDLAMVT